VATLEPQDKIGSAAELFLENLFHAVPIVKDDELQGIVTSFDIIKYTFHKEYPTQEI
jgi:CBS domain-containing protein